MLIDPASFSRFVILVGLFQFFAECDLGLSRLTDRWFTSNNRVAVRDVWRLLRLRLQVATAIILLNGIVAVTWGDLLAATAVVGGVGMMLSNGPLAIYRARSQIAAFTVTSISLQFGMSLPRFVALLVGGIPGCVLAFCAWYVTASIVLYARFMGRAQFTSRVCVALRPEWPVLVHALPLFGFSSAWSLFLLINRFVCSALSSPLEAGLFGFGATLTLTGVGVVSNISQAYYPEHLRNPSPRRLSRQLIVLLTLTTVGAIATSICITPILTLIFPRYVKGAAVTAALFCSLPALTLNTWLLPMLIASSVNPITQATRYIGSSIVVLLATMIALDVAFGLDGQAWACVVAAQVLLALQLRGISRGKLMNPLTCRVIAILSGCVIILCAVIWCATFVARGRGMQ